jgi:Asp-tRNA(Asn)/Glu-tRNA(Gln) amidotransferase B subunit
MPLELTPNEVVGYRFAADWYNINVVLVKRHGPNSKHAGQEYAQVLAHCKDVDQAARWLLNHILRAQGEDAQVNRQAIDGSMASVTALMELVESAVAQVNAATAELQGRIDALGISQKELVKALGGQDAAGEDGADAGVAEG